MIMTEIVEDFEKRARFTDEIEADVIRQKLEQLVDTILGEVKKRDDRFQSTLIHSGSVYEGVKVRQPDEFDFMIKLDSLTNNLVLHPCEDRHGYVKLALDGDQSLEAWKEFNDEQGFFSPNTLCHHFKKLVNESCRATEIPKGLAIHQTNPILLEGPWGSVFTGLVGGDSDSSEAMYIESHGPATTITITWQGDSSSSYRDLEISVDLTLSLEYTISKLPVQLSEVPPSVNGCLQRKGFHVVPAGFDMWRISFSMAEKELLSSSPDGFKACYRVLKYTRDVISDGLGLDAALVPSYIFKCVLLSRLSSEGDDSWGKELWLNKMEHILEGILKGIMCGDIQSFFLSRYNLLSTTDHRNKLRQFIVEDMLHLVRGQKMDHTLGEVNESRKQIRVLEIVDLVEYTVSHAIAGGDPVALWNKAFVNIGDIPVALTHEKGRFYEQITDLNSLDLDEDVYIELVQMWKAYVACFDQLIAYLPGELKILAQKFYLRTCEKRQKFELEHTGVTQRVTEQISIHQIMCDKFIEQYADDYINELSAASFSNLHKSIPPEYKPLGFLRDVAEVTMTTGSEAGRAAFKQRLKQFLAFVPDSVLMSVIVGYVSQIFSHGRDVLRRKLDYIAIIPELDLD